MSSTSLKSKTLKTRGKFDHRKIEELNNAGLHLIGIAKFGEKIIASLQSTANGGIFGIAEVEKTGRICYGLGCGFAMSQGNRATRFATNGPIAPELRKTIAAQALA